jgi:hypothetical protein
MRWISDIIFRPITSFTKLEIDPCTVWFIICCTGLYQVIATFNLHNDNNNEVLLNNLIIILHHNYVGNCSLSKYTNIRDISWVVWILTFKNDWHYADRKFSILYTFIIHRSVVRNELRGLLILNISVNHPSIQSVLGHTLTCVSKCTHMHVHVPYTHSAAFASII